MADSSTAPRIVGSCGDMCPRSEIILREGQKRLSPFEMQPGTENSPLPRADPSRCVKEFVRSAAGRKVPDPSVLRDAGTLQKTLHYLFTNILEVSNHGKPLLIATNFISDRARCVRQDIVVQRLPWQQAIPLLESIARYHILLRYILRSENLADFDPALNDDLTGTYLHDLMAYYEKAVSANDCACLGQCRLEKLEKCGDAPRERYCERCKAYCMSCHVLKNVYEFRSYRLLLNVRSSMEVSLALRLLLSCGDCVCLTRPLHRATRCAIHLGCNNAVRFFNSVSSLDFLQSCCLLDVFADVRDAFLRSLSVAYRSDAFVVPTLAVQRWLRFDSVQDAVFFGATSGYVATDEGFRFLSNRKADNMVEGGREKIAKLAALKCLTYIDLIESRDGAEQAMSEIVLGLRP